MVFKKMNFSHFILTRFNVKKMWSQDKRGNKVLTDEWLSHRFKLFENYCLPSIVNQENKNFIWLVYFDQDTDKLFINKINILAFSKGLSYLKKS